jgi:hypothetical protein
MEVGDVTITLTAPTRVELRTPEGSQQVELGTARGPTAARLVALYLVETGSAIDLPAPAGGVSAMGVSAMGIATVEARSPSSWHLDIASGIGHGAASIDLTMLSLHGEAIWRRGTLRWGGSLGWLHGLAKAADPTQPISADLGVVRAVAGLGVGRIEIIAGPELVAYRVGTTGSKLGFGAGGGVRAWIARIGRWRVIAGCDVDVFNRRVVAALDGVQFAATPRVAISAMLGLRWESP